MYLKDYFKKTKHRFFFLYYLGRKGAELQPGTVKMKGDGSSGLRIPPAPLQPLAQPQLLIISLEQIAPVTKILKNLLFSVDCVEGSCEPEI